MRVSVDRRCEPAQKCESACASVDVRLGEVALVCADVFVEETVHVRGSDECKFWVLCGAERM